MVIRKQYDIGQLVEQLQTEIEKSVKCGSVVKVDIITAYNILDVLNETNRMEQKYQTSESVLTSIEKEDGTKTNLMETEEVCCGCFDEDDIGCGMCDCMEQCKEVTENE